MCAKKGVKNVVLKRDRDTSNLDSSNVLHSPESLVSTVTDVVLDDALPVYIRWEETDGKPEGASCVHHDSTVHEGRKTVTLKLQNFCPEMLLDVVEDVRHCFHKAVRRYVPHWVDEVCERDGAAKVLLVTIASVSDHGQMRRARDPHSAWGSLLSG